MKYNALKSLAVVVIVCLFSFDTFAVGLQDYLQSDASTETVAQVTNTTANTNVVETSQLKYIIELVVAGIVASALIISVLAIFIGRWLANKEKRTIKRLRIEAEEDIENITSAAVTIREQEKETRKLMHEMRNFATEFTSQQKATEKYNKDFIESSEKIKAKEQEINEITQSVGEHMDEIKSYWEMQLKDTVSHIQKIQETLEKNLETVDASLEKMQQQKQLSQELLQEFLDTHNKQVSLVNSSAKFSEDVNKNLEQSFEESQQLINVLQKNKEEAEKSLNNYSEKLSTFEEQAYEQFDTSFQVADLARQELTANLDESRKHIETIRRQEEQSHNINAQTLKNLENLDYSKIIKIANTLDTTQNAFDDIHSKVEQTQHMLDELKELQADIEETEGQPEDEQIDYREANTPIIEVELETDLVVDKAISTETDISISNKTTESDNSIKNTKLKNDQKDSDNTTVEITDYKKASGDSTPLSFFQHIKKKKEK